MDKLIGPHSDRYLELFCIVWLHVVIFGVIGWGLATIFIGWGLAPLDIRSYWLSLVPSALWS